MPIIEVPGHGQVEFPDSMSDADIVAAIKKNSPVQAEPVTANQRAVAVFAGANRGIAGLAGLPVDTALNVWDLGKAGLGTIQGLVTGKPPSSIFDPADRSQYVGSSEQIANVMNRYPATSTQLPRPDDTASRYLYAGGAALPGAMLSQPTTMGQGLSAVASNVAPALSAQYAGEKFPNNPAAPILASLATQAAPTALANAIKFRQNPEIQGDVTRLENSGVRLDAAQRTGSGALANVKRAVSDNPFTGPVQADRAREQVGQFTRAVLNRAGIDADLATPQVLGAAITDIGQQIGDISARTPVRYTPQLHNDLMNVIATARRTLPESDVNILQNQIEFIQGNTQATPQGAMIPGETLRGAHTEIGSVLSRGGPLAHAMGELQSVLDDAVQNAAAPGDAPLLRESRQQYRALLQLGKAVDRNGEGFITPKKLANALTSDRAGKRQYFYNRGDQRLVELAQSGSRILPDSLPNSGTAPRSMLQYLPGALAAAGYSLMGGNPGPAVALGTGVYALPRLGQGLLNSPTALVGRSQLTPNRQLQYAAQQGLLANMGQ